MTIKIPPNLECEPWLKSEPVVLYECAWQNQWGVNYETGRDEIVVFDQIFFQNISPGLTAQPSLDITTGVFTCQIPGVYQVQSGSLSLVEPRDAVL